MIFSLLAQTTDDNIKNIFGGGIKDAPLAGGSISQRFSDVFGFALGTIISITALYVLLMVIWGALDWVKSEGDKTKLANAQAKIVNAFVGVFVMIFVLVVWLFASTTLLGTITREDGKLKFDLPSVGNIGKDSSSGPTLPNKEKRPALPELPPK